MRRWLSSLAALAAVASFVAYFFDPVHGQARRARVRAWALAVWERSLRAAGQEVPAEPPPEVHDAVTRLEEAMASAAASAPPPSAASAAPEAEEEPPRVTAVTLEPPRTDDLGFPDWDLGSEVPAFETEPARAPRRLIAAIAGAAALSLAVAVGLVVWAVWPSSGHTTTVDTRDLVRNQAQAIALLSQPKVKRIPVLGTNGRVILVYAPNGNAVLIASRVKAAPHGKAYEAWVIVGKKPIAAGLFTGGRSVVVPLGHAVPKGAVVAVTLEQARGVAMPTQKPLFAITRS